MTYTNNAKALADFITDHVTEYYDTKDFSDAFKSEMIKKYSVSVSDETKYIKLVNCESPILFIEKKTGNIKKPASFSHAEPTIYGNVNNTDYGISCLDLSPASPTIFLKFSR